MGTKTIKPYSVQKIFLDNFQIIRLFFQILKQLFPQG